MTTKFGLTAFNGYSDLNYSKKSLTATKHRAAHGKIFTGLISDNLLVYSVRNEETFFSHSACVVYTKTIIHLSVGESGGYLPCRFAAW